MSSTLTKAIPFFLSIFFGKKVPLSRQLILEIFAIIFKISLKHVSYPSILKYLLPVMKRYVFLSNDKKSTRIINRIYKNRSDVEQIPEV